VLKFAKITGNMPREIGQECQFFHSRGDATYTYAETAYTQCHRASGFSTATSDTAEHCGLCDDSRLTCCQYSAIDCLERLIFKITCPVLCVEWHVEFYSPSNSSLSLVFGFSFFSTSFSFDLRSIFMSHIKSCYTVSHKT